VHPRDIASLWEPKEHLTISRRSSNVPKQGQIILVGDLDRSEKVIDAFKITNVIHDNSICIVTMPDGSKQYRWSTYITARGRICGG
jgi:hypothetical protein